MSVIIGRDPQKSSATIEVVDDHGRVLAVGRPDPGHRPFGQATSRTRHATSNLNPPSWQRLDIRGDMSGLCRLWRRPIHS